MDKTLGTGRKDIYWRTYVFMVWSYTAEILIS